MKKLSDKVLQLEESATLASAARAKVLKAQGRDIIDLTLGQPDFVTPAHIGAAAKASIDSGAASFYTQVPGLPKLKDAVRDYWPSVYGFRPERAEVLVTSGSKFALYAFFQAVLDSGDEVIIPAPYWVSYVDQVKLVGGKPVIIETSQAADFKVTVEELAAHKTAKTKVLLINSPSNPTGMVYSAAELKAIGEWALSEDVLLLTDDIYASLVYNGAEFTAMAGLSEAIRRQTMVINGVSKSYAMTGWRIGVAVGDAEIISAMTKIAGQTTANPAAVSQFAAIAAYRADQAEVEVMRQAFEQRLNTIYPLLNEVPGFDCVKPRGAFYLFPKVAQAMQLTGFNDVDRFTEAILEEANLALVSGSGFGSSENIRLSYASDLATLEEGVKRLKAWVESKIRKG